MASSFPQQIPAIVYLLQQLKPHSVLDIGKGFGKYGFLIHEYVGINNQKRLDPSMSMAEQSDITIDAIEVDKDLLMPHLSQFYNKVIEGNVFDVYRSLGNYDLILMIDVIEHLDKEQARELLKYELAKSAHIIIATPIHFFEQELYKSVFEHHVSHWSKKDFEQLGFVEDQYFDGGAIYLISKEKKDIRGFGNSFIKRLRRIARAIRNEI